MIGVPSFTLSKIEFSRSVFDWCSKQCRYRRAAQMRFRRLFLFGCVRFCTESSDLLRFIPQYTHCSFFSCIYCTIFLVCESPSGTCSFFAVTREKQSPAATEKIRSDLGEPHGWCLLLKRPATSLISLGCKLAYSRDFRSTISAPQVQGR